LLSTGIWALSPALDLFLVNMLWSLVVVVVVLLVVAGVPEDTGVTLLVSLLVGVVQRSLR